MKRHPVDIATVHHPQLCTRTHPSPTLTTNWQATHSAADSNCYKSLREESVCLVSPPPTAPLPIPHHPRHRLRQTNHLRLIFPAPLRLHTRLVPACTIYPTHHVPMYSRAKCYSHRLRRSAFIPALHYRHQIPIHFILDVLVRIFLLLKFVLHV